MIIGPFVALSTTVSSPIWTQMAYPEKGRFQCFVNVQNYELYIPKRWNGKLTSVDFLHCSAFSNAFKILLLQKMHNPADHIKRAKSQWLRVELSTADMNQWTGSPKSKRYEQWQLSLSLHSAANAELPAHLHLTPKCKVASLEPTKL